MRIPFTVQAVELYPIMAGGVRVSHAGSPMFSAIGGGDLSIVTDTVKNYEVLVREQVVYQNRFAEEVSSGQGSTTFMLARKTVGVPAISVLGGLGYTYIIMDEKDIQSAVLKFEIDARLVKSLTVVAGCDYTAGVVADHDVWFPYLGINFSPKL